MTPLIKANLTVRHVHVRQGHTDDVYGCAWHPRKPHKFATVCDSSNVFLWNARRRQLIVSAELNLCSRIRTDAGTARGAGTGPRVHHSQL
jgi:WD40 repeat protein